MHAVKLPFHALLKFSDMLFFSVCRNFFKFMTPYIYATSFARVTCILSCVDFTEHSVKIIVK